MCKVPRVRASGLANNPTPLPATKNTFSAGARRSDGEHEPLAQVLIVGIGATRHPVRPQLAPEAARSTQRTAIVLMPNPDQAFSVAERGCRARSLRR